MTFLLHPWDLLVGVSSKPQGALSPNSGPDEVVQRLSRLYGAADFGEMNRGVGIDGRAVLRL